MSNRRRLRSTARTSWATWWDSTGLLLGCATCRQGPSCDVCDLPAQTVATIGVVHAGMTAVDLRGRPHRHLCSLCGPLYHQASGLTRTEVG